MVVNRFKSSRKTRTRQGSKGLILPEPVPVQSITSIDWKRGGAV